MKFCLTVFLVALVVVLVLPGCASPNPSQSPADRLKRLDQLHKENTRGIKRKKPIQIPSFNQYA